MNIRQGRRVTFGLLLAGLLTAQLAQAETTLATPTTKPVAPVAAFAASVLVVAFGMIASRLNRGSTRVTESVPATSSRHPPLPGCQPGSR